MFDPKVRRKTPEKDSVLLNWEADIHDVELETCDHTEDPLGYQVIFHTGEMIASAAKKGYVIGASHLVRRLASLRLAGYDAPMTQRAIKMLERRLGTEYFHV